jgi:hypothetical protein
VRRLFAAIVMALLLMIVAAVSISDGAGRPHHQVVCITQWDPHPHSSYRFRPHSCDFHERGKPYVHAYIQVARHLHWRYWSPRRALAHGKLGVSTYGLAPLRVKLSRPRHACGRTVFTKGRFRVRIRQNGRTHTYRYSVHLDKCTR